MSWVKHKWITENQIEGKKYFYNPCDVSHSKLISDQRWFWEWVAPSKHTELSEPNVNDCDGSNNSWYYHAILLRVSCYVLNWHDDANPFKTVYRKSNGISELIRINEVYFRNPAALVFEFDATLNNNNYQGQNNHEISEYMCWCKHFDFPHEAQKSK